MKEEIYKIENVEKRQELLSINWDNSDINYFKGKLFNIIRDLDKIRTDVIADSKEQCEKELKSVLSVLFNKFEINELTLSDYEMFKASDETIIMKKDPYNMQTQYWRIK